MVKRISLDNFWAEQCIIQKSLCTTLISISSSVVYATVKLAVHMHC